MNCTTLPSLTSVVEIVEAAGRLLAAEATRAGGPRQHNGHAFIDDEIAAYLRDVLPRLLPARWVCEETDTDQGHMPGFCWLVDPHDGTQAFLEGQRGTAVSVALLREGIPVLGVVHAPLPPDRHTDTIAWAEGAEGVLRNGVLLPAGLAGHLDAGAIVFVSHAAAGKPIPNGRAVAPGRFIALPSIAYRLARVACGDGVGAVSLNAPCGWDYAGGHALLRGTGGVLLDQTGREVTYTAGGSSHVEHCFGGSPMAARMLATRDWRVILRSPAAPLARMPTWPKLAESTALGRAKGCLFGLIAGDSLGGRVEFSAPHRIARSHPEGVRDLADGGVWDILAGQPTDDGELALSLARTLAGCNAWDAEAVAAAYGAWVTSDPFDMGHTTGLALRAAAAAQNDKAAAARRSASRESQANGALMRVAPIGLWARDVAEAAEAASEDARLTHPHPTCVAASAALASAIHVAVAGGGREDMQAAAEQAAAIQPAVLGVLREARDGQGVEDAMERSGWVLLALRNAFFRLWHALDLEGALVATVGMGGDTDTNAAIAGALLGAAYGIEAVPSRWRLAIQSCRPAAELGARRPRPLAYWPVDLPDLAEGLLARTGRPS